MQEHHKSSVRGNESHLTHPSPEQWMEYLYDEVSPNQRQTLSVHAETCELCSARLANWERARALLDKDGNSTTTIRKMRSSGFLKWAAAFAILACGIYGTVKGTVNAHQIADLRNSVAQSVRSTLESEIKSKLAAQQTETMESLRTELAKIREDAAIAWRTSDRQLLDSIAAITSDTRAKDREFLISALQQLEEKRSNELAALRKELETVAVLTEANFKKAQQQIVQLASFSDEATPLVK
ncbi:MAG: hypothetical protein JWM99_3709 [Verrucomicrobiales bacterium]|jgi:hypothetical protein|nr:hypothetical protein [Verrucomicrobiales bacterium]